jgi:hypothetical protein
MEEGVDYDSEIVVFGYIVETDVAWKIGLGSEIEGDASEVRGGGEGEDLGRGKCWV